VTRFQLPNPHPDAEQPPRRPHHPGHHRRVDPRADPQPSHRLPNPRRSQGTTKAELGVRRVAYVLRHHIGAALGDRTQTYALRGPSSANTTSTNAVLTRRNALDGARPFWHFEGILRTACGQPGGGLNLVPSTFLWRPGMPRALRRLLINANGWTQTGVRRPLECNPVTVTGIIAGVPPLSASPPAEARFRREADAIDQDRPEQPDV
jgi:hypothetical protein